MNTTITVSDQSMSICTAVNSIVIGHNNTCRHANCVLIGNGIHSTADNQFIIGNTEVKLTKTMTDREFDSIRSELLAALNALSRP